MCFKTFTLQLAGLAVPIVLDLFVYVCLCREIGEDADSQGDGSSQPDTISIASRTSQNTADSDKVEETLHDSVLIVVYSLQSDHLHCLRI